MKSPLKKLTAAVLAGAMVVPFGVTAFADTADNGSASTFDFSASDYAFNENDGTGTFTIKREGTGDKAARISFKAADMLAEYGVDYEILDAKGKPFAKKDGFKPDPKDFVFEEDGSGLALDESIANATADEPETVTVTKRRSTGVNVLDAQAEYLDLPAEYEDEVAVDGTQKVVNEMFDYFSKAQGTEGYVDFGIGETEKEITFKIYDNDEPDAQKLFALAIMATDDALATVAPNATTYVTIQDDEDVQPAEYAIKETELRLTANNPEGKLTVTRTGGEMYFSTATVSTVSLTAPDGSYEKLDGTTVAFVPGETEKTVDIKALSFDVGGRFGVRLEADNSEDATGNYYADVTIVKDDNALRERTPEELKELESSSADDVDTLDNEEETGITVGEERTKNNFLSNSQYTTSYDKMLNKATGVKGSGSYTFTNDVDGHNVGVDLTKNKQGLFWIITPEKINFTGIKSIDTMIGGNGISRFFEQSCESSSKPENCLHYCDNHNFYKDSNKTSLYEDVNIDVSKDSNPAYLALCVDRREYYDSKSHGLSWFYYWTYYYENWAKYTFDMQDSAATHQRPIYNFAEGAPAINYAYFDGLTSKIYSPGKVVAKDEDGNVVDSFYGSYNKPLYFTSTDEHAKQYGLYLEGIYFASTSKNVSNMCDDGKYATTDKVYYVPVDSATANSEDPTVTVTINQELLYTLYKKGVTSNVSKDENIKIFPKYTQRTKKVRFYNTDRPQGNPNYDKDNRFSEILNVVDAYEKYEAASDAEKKNLVKVKKVTLFEKPVYPATQENGQPWDTSNTSQSLRLSNLIRAYYIKVDEYNEKLASGAPANYYEIEMPWNSVLNLAVKSVAEKVPDGVSWNTISGNKETHHTWYKPNMTILSDGLDPTIVLTEADYTKAQIIVTDDIEVRPVTGAQNITVMYHPLEKIPAEYQGDRTVTELDENGNETTVTYKGLTNAVLLTDSLESDQVVGVDENGYYTEESAMGKEFSFTAFPPEGYVTYWVDMTQDVNGDGEIDFDEQDNARRGTDSPDILGNVFKGQVTSDRPRLYYFFYPKTELNNDHTITGRVKKNASNFVQLVKRTTTVSEEPVSDVVVNVGGYVGTTNRNGIYEIETELPVIGTTNVMLTSAGSMNYYTYQPLKANHNITMPALERFTADSISASIKHENKTENVTFNARGGTMGIYDGTATVTLKVKSDTAIMPAKARFFIEDQLGNRKVDCENDDDYTITNTVYGNTLTTTLKFNPKKACDDCDKIIVQFCDELGNWYRPIYTGINFFKPLDVTEFAFPLLGSDLIEDAYKGTLGYSLLGDPLGNLLTNKLNAFSEKSVYSPSNLSEEARESMSWARETYKLTYGKEFSILNKSFDSSKKKKDSDKDKSSDSDKDSDKSSDKDKDKGKDSDEIKQETFEIYDPNTGITKQYKYEDIYNSTDLDEWEKHIDERLAEAESAEESMDLFIQKCVLDETRDYKGIKSGVSEPAESKGSSGSYQTKGNFKFSVSANVGFRLTLSNREVWDDKTKGTTKHQYFFEDLMFYVQVAPKASASCSVAMPVGITVSLGFDFTGQITAVYYMYNDYRGDPNEGGMLDSASENLTPYDFHDFNLFDKFGEGSNLRRNFYLFLDPTIAISVGLKYKIFEISVTAKFAFDMDFRWTEASYYAYGDIAVYVNYKIKVAGFEVYSDSIGSKDGLVRAKLFNTPNQDGHIGFNSKDVTVNPSGTAAQLLQLGSGEDAFATSDIPDRGDKSAWNGTPDTPLNEKGSTEITLETGAESDAQVKMMKINDDEMLMIFIDDDHSRSAVNRRALYYSIGSGTNWSTPKLLDKDGTIDDYPDICDLGNGKLLVTWSSANKVLPDNAGVEDALKALDIKVAFFDKATKTFDKPEQLTKTTEEDYTADMFPHAAYDAETNRIILYYTKTEFEDVNSLEDLGEQSTEYSVMAYLFYEFEDGKWSNDGSFYTEDEIKRLEKTAENDFIAECAKQNKDYTDAELKAAIEKGVADYKANWYGQRFVDLRTDSNAMKLVVDSTAIGYNGLGLFAWTVDNDDNMNTTDDRDVFLQIYEFSSNTFTHVIKLTNESGDYAAPKFARSNNNTYLFFGNKVTGDEEDHGEIDYLNISEIVKNKEYTKVEGAQRPYYVLKTTTVDADGNQVEMVTRPDTAIVTDNYEDYQPVVAENGTMYILWGDKEQNGDAVQINAAYFIGDDFEDGSGWSEAVTLTNAESGMYYNGIGAAIIDGDIKIGALKSSFEDETNNSLMFITHTPYAQVVIDSLTTDTKYPMPGDAVVLTATLKNTGLLMYDGDIEATFTCEGSDVGSAVVEGGIQGAAQKSATLNVTLPETEGDITYAVSALDQTEEVTIKKSSVLVAGAQDISLYDDTLGDTYYAFTCEIANDGNADANNVTVTVNAGDAELASQTIDVLVPNQREEIKLPIEISEALYEIGEDGVGTVDLTANIKCDDSSVDPFEYTVSKDYDMETVALLDKITEIKFDEDGKATMTAGETKDIQPELVGIDNGELSVKWKMSSDPTIASVDANGEIVGVKAGTVTLTGIVLPDESYTQLDSFGREKQISAVEKIPVDKVKVVEVELTVSGKSNEGIFGDLDGDGEVTSADALIALRISAQLDESTPEKLALGDIDGDGQITSGDALEILRFSTSLSTNDKIGKAITA